MNNIGTLHTGADAVVAVGRQQQTGLLCIATETGAITGLDVRDSYRKVLDIDTGLRRLAHMEVHPSAPLIAIAGDGTVQVWDIRRRQRLFQHRFDEGVGLGTSMMFHPASSQLLFGGYDYDIVAIGYLTGEIRRMFSGMDFNIRFALHPGGSVAAASWVIPQDGAGINFFSVAPTGDVTSYETPYIDIGPEAGVCPVFSADGRLLIAGYTDMTAEQTAQDVAERGALFGTVRIYDFPSCRELYTLDITGDADKLERSGALYHSPGELSVCVLPDAPRYAVCGTSAGTLVVVECTTGRVEKEYRVTTAAVTSLVASDALTVFAGCSDGTVVECVLADIVAGPMDGEGAARSSGQEFLQMAAEGEW